MAALRRDFAEQGIELEVLTGGELSLERLATLGTDELRRFSLAGSERYVLVEFPYTGWPLGLENAIHDLGASGLTALLAHPERNRAVQAEPERLERAIGAGALVQVTASSVDGRGGAAARTAARRLLELGFVHVLASDAHHPAVREAGLAAAVAAIGDPELARHLVQEVPAAIVAGASIPAPAAAAPSCPPGIVLRIEMRSSPVKRRGLRYAIAAVVFVAVVTGAVAAWALTAPTRYVARAQVLLTPIAAGDHTFDGFSVLRESSDAGRAARTAALLFATPQVAEGVRVQLGLDQSAASLLKSVKVTAAPGRNLVTVAASAAGPQRAADLANAFAAQAIAARTAHFSSELQTAIARARSRLAAIPPVQRVLPASRALQERLGTLNGLVGTSDPTLEVGSAATAPTAPERTRSLVLDPRRLRGLDAPGSARARRGSAERPPGAQP